MGRKGKKRGTSETSPSDGTGEPKTKMAQQGNKGGSAEKVYLQLDDTRQLQQQQSSTASFIVPATLQYPPGTPNQPPYYAYPHSGSPMYTPQQQHGIPGIPNGQTCSTPKHNDDLLLTILGRIESIEQKLGQLDKISVQVADISTKMGKMESRMTDIEQSQKFICDKFDEISVATAANKDSIKSLQHKVESLERENVQIRADRDSISEDIIDLKCRSMRDNLLFFGIEEGRARQVRVQESSGQVPENRNQESVNNFEQEDCDSKVFQFCESVLKIQEPKAKIRIDRSHRIGARTHDKTRPIVVKFLDTNSKFVVKNALKNVNLKNTPYNVSEQYPIEVQERRRSLIPVMVKARQENKKAVLVRDKLYINNRLYTPQREGSSN